jgi:energy-converting hydrogenase Eha subunit C
MTLPIIAVLVIICGTVGIILAERPPKIKRVQIGVAKADYRLKVANAKERYESAKKIAERELNEAVRKI